MIGREGLTFGKILRFEQNKRTKIHANRHFLARKRFRLFYRHFVKQGVRGGAGRAGFAKGRYNQKRLVMFP